MAWILAVQVRQGILWAWMVVVEVRQRRRGEDEEEEEEEEEEKKATNIKSNNHHLAGGEKVQTLDKLSCATSFPFSAHTV